MTANINKEGAFASQSVDESNLYVQEGLTKREYFAGLAMQGLLNHHLVKNHNNETIDWITKHAIAQADDLLLELSKNKE